MFLLRPPNRIGETQTFNVKLFHSVFLPVWITGSVCFGEEETFADNLAPGKTLLNYECWAAVTATLVQTTTRMIPRYFTMSPNSVLFSQRDIIDLELNLVQDSSFISLSLNFIRYSFPQNLIFISIEWSSRCVVCVCFYLHGEGDERSLRRSSQQIVIPDDWVVTHTANLSHTHTRQLISLLLLRQASFHFITNVCLVPNKVLFCVLNLYSVIEQTTLYYSDWLI